ncbi:MAG: hypothetical protein JO152_14620 [Mycobacteriaceae bacterium]|nr:hypothetical protein [Mycobacteriaceae bacterium]
MIRALVISAVAGAAFATAPVAAADDSNLYFDKPGHYESDVPNMSYDASLGAPCDSWERFVFGRGPGGQAEACHWIPNQWPPVTTGFWTISYQLYGVQNIGAPCPGPQSAAQSPDGLPMLCLGDQGWQPGWYTGNGFFPPED